MKQYKYKVNGAQYDVTIDSIVGNKAKVEVNGIPFEVEMQGSSLVEADLPTQAPIEGATPAAAPATPAPAAATPAPGITQRKTLKISRPGAIKPAGKFAVKKPSAVKPPEADKVDDIEDIPDIPTAIHQPTPIAPSAAPAPSWMQAFSLTVQVAACVAMGVLAYFLFESSTTNYF